MNGSRLTYCRSGGRPRGIGIRPLWKRSPEARVKATMPRIASETTWNATSSRLCLITGAHQAFDLLAEAFAAEALGVRANRGRIESPADRHIDRRCKRLGSRFVHQQTRLILNDRFRGAAAAERHDRPSARLRLERHDAEIFSARQQDARRPPVQLADVVVAPAPEKFRGSGRDPFERAPLRSVAGDLQ